ncbi:DUF4386 domain-containing protein [Sphingorhabdus sp.]|uniref:DUF4386 domain-containing protein n=1 Tax=Sphingorhabdus sp. TaxID=1902408 RepID=UPI0032B730C1
MSENKKIARFAGLLYLIVVLGGIASLAYVPNVIENGKDGAALVVSIQTHQTLFRFGIAAGLVCYTAFLLLPLVLYRLLAPFGRQAAIAMVALATASVPFAFANLVHRMDVLSLLGDEPRSAMLTATQLQTQVTLALESYWNGIFVLTIFWGLWLLPFGWLMFRSRMIPRIFGLLLMAGCFGYLIAFFGQLLVPDFAQLAFARYITLPATLGEIGTCLWLLIMGVRDQPIMPAQTSQNPPPARQS